jgi:hypothetical protein
MREFRDLASSSMRVSELLATEALRPWFAYFAATRAYLETHGKPVAFYSDKHSVFRISKPAALGDGMTQFGRAMSKMNIEIICANSSQAVVNACVRIGRH